MAVETKTLNEQELMVYCIQCLVETRPIAPFKRKGDLPLLRYGQGFSEPTMVQTIDIAKVIEWLQQKIRQGESEIRRLNDEKEVTKQLACELFERIVK